jgi:hypothetical protein
VIGENRAWKNNRNSRQELTTKSNRRVMLCSFDDRKKNSIHAGYFSDEFF